MLSIWGDLCRNLLSDEKYWEVWIDWYDRILDGKGDYSVEVGVFRVTLDRPESWELTVGEVNRRIIEKIEDMGFGVSVDNADFASAPPDLPNLPPQSLSTESFSTDPVKPTDLAVEDGAASLGTSPERREGYEELQYIASELWEMGDNRLGRLSSPCRQFRALGSAADNVRVFPFWSRANALRIVLRGHEMTQAFVDPDERRLDPVVAGQLLAFVEAFQAYCLGDLRLLRNEQSRPGPRESQTARDELQPLKPVLQSLVSDEDLATGRAADVLADACDTIETAPDDLTGRQGAELGRVTLSNLVLSLLVKAKLSLGPEGAFAWREFRGGAYKYAGGAAVVGIAAELAGQTTVTSTFLHFMASNADAFIAYAKLTAMNPGVINFLRWIQAQFGP